MLAGKGESTNIVYNYLCKTFEIDKVIIEYPRDRIQFLKKRVKRLGYVKVFGQILFYLISMPYLRISSKKRIIEIKKIYNLDDSHIEMSKIIDVPSANSDVTINILREINPDIVIVNGTRIISKKILNCIDAKFINMHAGITPLYRGVHGGYWSLVEGKIEACGVTVHFVDQGIDTGNIIEQAIIKPTKRDNFITYPLLQLGVGLPKLKTSIKKLLESSISTCADPEGESKLWSHPTLWEYLWYRIYKGVK